MRNSARDEILRLTELISRLEKAEGPDRDLDYEIAELTGWRQNGTGDRVVWLHPDTFEQARVPRYTKFLHDSHFLAHQIMPNHVGGMAWELGKGSAQIEGYPPETAVSPAIALCLVALRIKRNQDISEFAASSRS